MKHTKAEHESMRGVGRLARRAFDPTKEEEILASIIAAGETDVYVRRGSFVGFPFREIPFLHGRMSRDLTAEYPACAVGAGLLYAGIPRTKIMCGEYRPCQLFANEYGVSEEFAIGVSDGFEGKRGSVYDRTGNEVDQRDPDYASGRAVGAAVYAALVDGGAE